jgi:hypothetical protein
MEVYLEESEAKFYYSTPTIVISLFKAERVSFMSAPPVLPNHFVIRVLYDYRSVRRPRPHFQPNALTNVTWFYPN